MDQLFSYVYFEDVLYNDAAAVWESTVASYFKEDGYPKERTAVVRYEDFLFKFADVIQALRRRGLPWREDAPATLTPIDSTAKDSTHPIITRRGRPQLLAEYGDPAKRYRNMTKQQIERLGRLDARLISQLHYGVDAVSEWVTAA